MVDGREIFKVDKSQTEKENRVNIRVSPNSIVKRIAESINRTHPICLETDKRILSASFWYMWKLQKVNGPNKKPVLCGFFLYDNF